MKLLKLSLFLGVAYLVASPDQAKSVDILCPKGDTLSFGHPFPSTGKYYAHGRATIENKPVMNMGSSPHYHPGQGDQGTTDKPVDSTIESAQLGEHHGKQVLTCEYRDKNTNAFWIFSDPLNELKNCKMLPGKTGFTCVETSTGINKKKEK